MSQRDEELDGAVVHNAADSRQVREGKKRERAKRKSELDDLRTVLATEAGRRVLWRLLEHTSPFSCALGATDALTNFTVGRQDVGHFLTAEITAASPDAFIAMMRANSSETDR